MGYVFPQKNKCCGCGMCSNICPCSAIKMEQDEEGFLYPNINESLCNSCNLCRKLCSFQSLVLSEKQFSGSIFAVKHISDDVRYNSSSGGMFTAISDVILSKNGSIYGAAFNENMHLCHQKATTINGRNQFRGSKYLQSETQKIFKSVEKDINDGLSVLFSGTPCQIAALRNYFLYKKIPKDKLILCDIVCHGVNSPKLFKDYIKYCNNPRMDRIVKKHLFRSKIKGWHAHTEVNIFYNGRIDYKSYKSQLWKKMFYSHLLLRPSCFQCPYTNLDRLSDMTLADYRGIENYLSSFDDDKGTSLVIVNTDKGKILFNACKDLLIYKQISIDVCMQPNMSKPSSYPLNRHAFWNEYFRKGFEGVCKKYFWTGGIGYVKRKLYFFIKSRK
jgi:Fe-S-cluster-containing hydrogenase component 2